MHRTGPGRWLPKPSDVVATFSTLANPDLDDGGGYKGTRLLWWKWLLVADVVGFLIPDGLVDALREVTAPMPRMAASAEL